MSVRSDPTPEIEERYTLELIAITTISDVISLSGAAVFEEQGTTSSITIRASNNPHGVIQFQQSSLVARSQDGMSVQFTIIREFGTFGEPTAPVSGTLIFILLMKSSMGRARESIYDNQKILIFALYDVVCLILRQLLICLRNNIMICVYMCFISVYLLSLLGTIRVVYTPRAGNVTALTSGQSLATASADFVSLPMEVILQDMQQSAVISVDVLEVKVHAMHTKVM